MKIIRLTLALNLVILSVAAAPVIGGESEIRPHANQAVRHQSSGNNAEPTGSAPLSQSSSEQYKIIKQTIDNGGEHAISNQFVISGSIGQPEASATRASVGYRLSGGFWFGANGVIEPTGELIFADSFESQ